MKRFRIGFLAILLLLLIVIGGLSVTQPVLAKFRTADANPLFTNAPNTGSPEFWNTGVTLEGSDVYSNIVGRLMTGAASIRSNAGTQDIYYIFPAPSSLKTVVSARYYLLARTGAFSGNVVMVLEVHHLNGTFVSAVSPAAINLKTAPVGIWQDITLSSLPGNLVVNSGDYLTFHVYLDAPAGNLDIRPIFDVMVQ